MSNKVIRLLLLLGVTLLPAAIFYGDVQATHASEQEFTFECKTKGEYSVLRFVERRFGERERTNRIALYLGPDNMPPIMLPEYGYAENMVQHRAKEPFVEIVDSVDSFVLYDSVRISPPAVDSVFADSLMDLVRKGTQITEFYRDCHHDCIDEPRFENINAELVWVYGAGLYKNYSIEKIIYFPDSDYVLIFTHQPVQFSYKVTWHGVLLYKLRPK